jgi:thiamine biosynthesis lipoprotein
VAVTRDDALAEARAMLAADLAALDLACSRFRADSELTHMNAHAGERVPVSPLLASATRVALAAAEASDGLVDPALGLQLRAAGYDRTFTLVRARDTWHVARPPRRSASWRDIELDLDQSTLLIPAGLELDLGATAKAWAADRAAARIASRLGCGALVSLGGDVAVAGNSPAAGWPVRLAADHTAPLDGPGPVVAISNGGLATSSTAARCWSTDRGEAHHILDPRTGRPAPAVWSYISVAAASCTDANVAATAAVILGESALAWLSARHLPARAVRTSGSVAYAGDWPAERRAA